MVPGLVAWVPRPAIPVKTRPEHPVHVRVLAHDGHLLRELPFRPDVVRVEERDELAPRLAEPEVARGGDATILVARMLDVEDPPRVLRGAVPRERGRFVRAPVIDEHELPVGVVLPEDALHGLAKEGAGIQ